MRTDLPSTGAEGTVLSRAAGRTLRTVALLVRIVVPLSFGVALLEWSGGLEPLSRPLGPLMHLFGLPAEAAVPLLSGWLVGPYGTIAAISPLDLSAVAITVVCAMVLVAHNLPVECIVQHKAGTPWRWMLTVRMAACLLLGGVLGWTLGALDRGGIDPVWLPLARPHAGAAETAATFGAFLTDWGEKTARLLVKIALIVSGMMFATEWMRASGVMRRLERACRPALRLLGLPDAVAMPWLTAQVVGISYGAGLLIEEVRDGGIGPGEARSLNTSIGISHSLLEDSVILAALGACLFWTIVPRFLLAALAVRLLARVPVRAGSGQASGA